MGRFHSRRTTVRLQELGGVLGMTAGPGPGDLTFDPIAHGNTERIRVTDRGHFECYLATTDNEQSWSITIEMPNETLTEAVLERIQDLLLKQGAFSGMTTTDANADIHAFEVLVTMTGAGGLSETYLLPNCLGQYAFAESMEGNTITISGVNNGPLEIDGVAISEAT